MLQIGDFAGITGLSVKALRHYGEKAVLVPEVVDERSGYRWYGEGQVRAGATIRAMRAAGVPLPEIAVALGASSSGADGALDALETHRERVLEERAREDLAHETAVNELRALRVPVHVELRQQPEQHFVGRALHAPGDDLDELTDEDANAVFGELFERLAGAGIPVSGEFWTTLGSGENGGAALLGCWEVPSSLGDGWTFPGDRAGTLPRRTELVATWRPENGEALPEGATHPAIVALFDALDERGIELRLGRMEVRQTIRGQDPNGFSVEVSVLVEER